VRVVARQDKTSLARAGEGYVGRFTAMASPCEVLVDTDDETLAASALRIAEAEAQRIECTFSRYRIGNIVHRINTARGKPVAVDAETALLIDYAATCHAMSDGLFDITSGVLRRVWRFDGSDRVPDAAAVRDALRHVGWQRAHWEGHVLTMPAGMEIDFGGIGKEYAVDRSASLIGAAVPEPFLVNFGGDLFASRPRRGGRAWGVGLDDPRRTGEAPLERIDLPRGGLATSGDARRFVLHRGRRLGHILNPKTGWPIEGAPRSVTVVASTCVEAGTLSTLAYLQGPRAARFLEEQGVSFRIL
jgi:thiamine biosynthesis lipoprotein